MFKNINGSSSQESEESDERVSICSMENNRSNSASPVSSLDEKMMDSIEDCYINEKLVLSLYKNNLNLSSYMLCNCELSFLN